jgi:hypothetical protein
VHHGTTSVPRDEAIYDSTLAVQYQNSSALIVDSTLKISMRDDKLAVYDCLFFRQVNKDHARRPIQANNIMHIRMH